MKTTIFTLIMVIVVSSTGFCDVSVHDFELVPRKEVYRMGEPIQAILFARTIEYGARINLNPFDIFSVYIYPIGRPGNIIAQKSIQASAFPEILLPGRRVVRDVLDITDGRTLRPGTFILVFIASYHHGGLPFSLETQFSVGRSR